MQKRPFLPLVFAVLIVLGSLVAVRADQRSWIGANNTWTDGGSTAFWSPADEPDADDEAIFNTANTVLLGSDNLIQALTLSGGIDLDANGFRPLVATQTTLSGTGTVLILRPRTASPTTSSFISTDMDVNSTAQVTLIGGILDVGTLLEINSGSVNGRGTVIVGDTDAIAETALENSSLIAVTSGVLTLSTRGVDRLDLDGTSETGVLDVANASVLSGTDIQSLIIDGELADAFSGTLQVGQRDTVTFNNSFAMNGADVVLDGGLFVATMTGASTTITATTLSVANAAVIENDVTFSGTANTIMLNAGSTLRLNGTVGVADASALSRAAGSDLIIAGNTLIQEAGGDFQLDTAPITVVEAGRLTLSVDQLNPGSNLFNGRINLNDQGDLAINVSGTSWSMDGMLVKSNLGVSTVSGDAINVTGEVIVNAGTLELPVTALSPGAVVTTHGVLSLGDGSILAGPASVTGTGTLKIEGDSLVTASTTINTHTFDWDGTSAASIATILDGVSLTINSVNFDNDGNTTDFLFLGGNGAQINVNGPSEWAIFNPLTLNTAASGLATIGGTSRLFIRNRADVDGDTTISAPWTLASSTAAVHIDLGKLLNANNDTVYASGTITGAGRYNPGPTNTVIGDTTISTSSFDFDAGIWAVENGAELSLNVADYDAGTGTNSFDSTITLNGGTISVTTNDLHFVMDGRLNMIFNGSSPNWRGEPIEIGNDTGILDADLVVSGGGKGTFDSMVILHSDADIDVAAGATLEFNEAVVFETLNGSNFAEITGAGIIRFNDPVNVNEAVTFNMPGGTVDFDGSGSFAGDTIHVDAPIVVMAANMDSFGKTNSIGVNVIDIDQLSVGSNGKLSVLLDDPTAEWTINPEGVISLHNDLASASTLIDGNALNLNGTLNVTGNVRVSARIDMGTTGIVSLAGVNEKLHLSGGNLFGEPNTMQGASIQGMGVLVVQDQKSLFGFGTIQTAVNNAGFSMLRADNGTLTIEGPILNAPDLGTNDADGILNIPAAWNNDVTHGVALRGGIVQGGTITNDANIQGSGLVTARVINNQLLLAAGPGGALTFQTAGNDNDWDGTAGNGILRASAGDTLELRDNATFAFTGTVSVSDEDSRIFANGFTLDLEPSSMLFLEGTFESTAHIPIGGTVSVGVDGGTLKSGVGGSILFESGSSTTLHGDLKLVSSNARFEAGATFSGSDALIISTSSEATANPNSNIEVLLINEGNFRIAGGQLIGRVDLRDFQQSESGRMTFDLSGTDLNEFDRIVIDGGAQLDGQLTPNLVGSLVPSLGQVFHIISAVGGITGEFREINLPMNFPANLRMDVDYLPTLVQLRVLPSGDFAQDGVYNCADVDELTVRIASGSATPAFDLNGDSRVDPLDLAEWLSIAGRINLPSGNPYRMGDANLDGVVDGSDFGIWNSNKFTSSPFWCSGDFSADGVIDGSDFGIWNSNKFTASDTIGRTSVIPEPTFGLLVFLGGYVIAARKGGRSEWHFRNCIGAHADRERRRGIL